MGQNLNGNDEIGRQDYVFKLTSGREISYEVSLALGQRPLSMAAVSLSR